MRIYWEHNVYFYFDIIKSSSNVNNRLDLIKVIVVTKG